jgi:hypothetical protein
LSYNLKNNFILDNGIYIGWRNSVGNTVGVLKTDTIGNVFFNSLGNDLYINHSSGGNANNIFINGFVSMSNLLLSNSTISNFYSTNNTLNNLSINLKSNFGSGYQLSGSSGTTSFLSGSTTNFINATLNLTTAVNNSGNITDSPYPIINMFKPGINSQSYDNAATFYINRFTTGSLNSNSELQLGLSNTTVANGSDSNTITWKYRSDGTSYALGTVNSTDTSTGTLVVNGGVAIQKNLNIGSNISAISSTIQNSVFTNITTTNISSLNTLNANTISVGNILTSGISLVNLSSTNSTINNILATTSTIPNAVFTNISSSSISSTSSTIPNSVLTNITTTNISVLNTLNANTISVGNILTSGISLVNLSSTNSTINNILATTSTIPNSVFTNISSGSISSTSSTIPNSVFTNISSSSISSTSSTIQNTVFTNLSSGTVSATTSTIPNSVFTNICSNSAIISSNVNIKNIATIGNSITSTTANLFVNGAISSNAVKSNQAGSLSSFSGGDIGFYYVGTGTLQFVNNATNTASISNNGTFLSANVNTGNKLNTFGVNYQGVGYNSTQTSNYIQASLNLNTAVNNSGTTADTPYPVLNLIKGGVSGQSYDSVAAFYLNRFSTSGVNANTELQLGLANNSQGNGTDSNTITWKYRSDGTSYALGTVDSTNTSTGTLVVNGGVAIQKNLNIGSNISAISSTIPNSVFTNITTTNISVLNTLNANAISVANLTFTNSTINNILATTSTIPNAVFTNVTTTNISVLNTLNANSISVANLTFTNSTINNILATTSTIPNAVFTNITTTNISVINTLNANTISVGNILTAGISVTNLTSTNNTITNGIFTGTVDSTNTSTGTLVVNGGVAIQKNLNVGSNISSNSGANFISCAGSLTLTNNTLSNINLGKNNAKILTNSADLIVNGDSSFSGTLDTFTQNTNLFNNIATASVLNTIGNFVQGYYGKNILYTSGGNAFISNNYGNNFSTIPITTGSINFTLNAINYNSQYLLSVGVNSTSSSLYSSNTYGNSWINTQTYVGYPAANFSSVCISGNGQYQLAAFSANAGFAPTTFTTGMVLSNNYGSTFNYITVTSGNIISGTNGSFISCAADYTGKNLITILGQQGATTAEFVYVSNNYGTSWIQTDFGNNNSLVSVDVSATGQYMVALSFATNGPNTAGIYLSSNFGLNWSAVHSFSGNANNVYISYSGQYIVVPLYSTGAGFAYSSDYGVTWTVNNSLISNFGYAHLSKNGRNLLCLNAANNNGYIITHSLNTSLIDFGAGISGNSRNGNAGQISYNGNNLNIYGAGTSTRTVNILDNLNSVTLSSTNSTITNSVFTNISSSSISSTSSTIPNSVFTNITTTNISVLNTLNANAISVANLTFTNSTISNIVATTSTIPNAIFTNVTTTNISVLNTLNANTISVANSLFANITTTNISVLNTLNANTISVGNILTAGISVANLTSTNNTITNGIFTGTVDSTNTSTGTLVVNGGVGIAKNLYVGGLSVITSPLLPSGSSTIVANIYGALYVSGNISINGNFSQNPVSSSATLGATKTTDLTVGGVLNVGNIATIGNSVTSTTANLFVNGVIASNAVKSNQAGSLSSFSGGDIGFYYVQGGTLQFVNSGANTASISNNGTFLSANVNTGNKLNTFGVNYQGIGYNSTQTSNYIQASLNLNTAVNNSGTTADTPYPVLNLIKGGVSGQSYDSVAAFYLNRFSTSGVNANTELQLGLANGIQGNGTDTNTITWKYRSDGTTYALGTVNSTDTSTGTLVINGGVAIQKNLNVGANINCTANIVSNSYYGNSSGFVLYTNSTNKGISINSSGDLSGNSTTDSSSKVTGSITTQGGMGINKSLYVGGNIVSSFDTVSTLRFYTGSFTLNGFATGTSAVGLNISNFSNPNGGLPGHTGVYMYNVYGVNNSGYAAYGSFYVWSPALQNVSQTYSAGLSVTLGTGGNFNIDNNSGITLNIIMYITAVS